MAASVDVSTRSVAVLPSPSAAMDIEQRTRDEAAARIAPFEERFERIARLAHAVFGVQSVEIRFIGADQEWTKFSTGVPVSERVRDALADLALTTPKATIASDAQIDPRLRKHRPLLADAGIHFYAAMPLKVGGGDRLGTLSLSCADRRDLSNIELEALRDLAAGAAEELVAMRDLFRAGDVQRSLLPEPMVTLEGYDVVGASRAAGAIGGDFYDWYPSPGGAAFTMADVMGKGLSGAIVAAAVRSVMRTVSRGSGVVAAMEAATEELEADLDAAGTFVTLFHAYLEARTGVVSYVDAGHGLSVVVRASAGWERLSSQDMPMGASLDSTWHEGVVVLNRGDTLVSVSDGVLDLFDGTLESLAELEKIVRSSLDPQHVADRLMAIAGTDAPDDVSIIVVRRNR